MLEMLEMFVVKVDVSYKAISNTFNQQTQLWKYLKLRLIQENTFIFWLEISFFRG
jgi:hypothetical protein